LSRNFTNTFSLDAIRKFRTNLIYEIENQSPSEKYTLQESMSLISSLYNIYFSNLTARIDGNWSSTQKKRLESRAMYFIVPENMSISKLATKVLKKMSNLQNKEIHSIHVALDNEKEKVGSRIPIRIDVILIVDILGNYNYCENNIDTSVHPTDIDVFFPPIANEYYTLFTGPLYSIINLETVIVNSDRFGDEYTYDSYGDQDLGEISIYCPALGPGTIHEDYRDFLCCTIYRHVDTFISQFVGGREYVKMDDWDISGTIGANFQHSNITLKYGEKVFIPVPCNVNGICNNPWSRDSYIQSGFQSIIDYDF